MLSTWPRLSRQSQSQLWQKMKRGRNGERKRGKKTHSPTLAESMYIQPNSLSLSPVSILLRATWRMSNGYKKPPLNVANLWALFVASL